MMYGIYISRLEIRGDNLKPAFIEFDKGFNLISGGSDTGKSYAFACLEYMFGKLEAPDSIPQSSGYINIFLEINTYTNHTYTLFRKLNGGDFSVKECKISEFYSSGKNIETYSPYPNASKNISDFLLKLCGYELGVQIKFNKDNVKRKFTFNILRNLTFINETDITLKTSPFYGSQSYTDFTFYKNAVSYILTGKNANELISVVDNQQMKSWTNGKIDFIKSQTLHFEDHLKKLNEERLKYADKPQDLAENLKIKLENLNNSLNKYTERKSELLNEVENKRSSLIYKQELIDRLYLLKKHYISDQQRLGFILEGEQLLSQLNTVDCPICEGVLSEDKISYIQNTEDVKYSIGVENEKIQLKIIDLTKTIDSNLSDIKSLEFDINLLEFQFERTDKLIVEELNPSIDNLRAEISNVSIIQQLDAKISVYSQELEYYLSEETGLKNDLNKEIIPTSTGQDGVGINNLMSFIKNILKDWNYETGIDINFNNNHKIFDIDISGKPRGSYGKGMRSISYTAVILSILKYCLVNSRPFSNLLVFDSPLTTYHKGLTNLNETDEEISKGIQESFFRDLSNTPENCQIIVFDNKFPDDKTSAKINFEYFTKDKKLGRYGLFPLK